MGIILFFGDSLTAGYGLPRPNDESFPALIQYKINAAALKYEVINAGLSGDTSGGGLIRLNYWLNRSIDIFVLELGINDILRGVAPSETHRNLQFIIDRVKLKYPRVKLALMGMEVPGFIPAASLPQFRQIFRKLAESNNMTYVPFFLDGVAGEAHLNLGDGIHPAAAGYKVIADKVWPMLRPLLED